MLDLTRDDVVGRGILCFDGSKFTTNFVTNS